RGRGADARPGRAGAPGGPVPVRHHVPAAHRSGLAAVRRGDPLDPEALTEVAMGMIRASLLALIAGFLAPVLAVGQDKSQVDVEIRDDSFTMPADLMLRARVTAMTPSEPTSIQWRWGGEGLGGTPMKGVFGENLAPGTWSAAVPVASLVKGKFPGKLFLTVMVGRGGKRVRDAGGKGLDGPARSEG